MNPYVPDRLQCPELGLHKAKQIVAIVCLLMITAAYCWFLYRHDRRDRLFKYRPD